MQEHLQEEARGMRGVDLAHCTVRKCSDSLVATHRERDEIILLGNEHE